MLLHQIYINLKRTVTEYFRITKLLSHQVAIDKISDLYLDLPNWYVSRADNIFVENKLDNTLYGEITYQGMEILANKLQLTS